MNREYEDMLDMPHHKSDRHPPMSMSDRAAQFAPFQALTGYKDAVTETARLTDRELELDEQTLELLDEKLLQLQMELQTGTVPVKVTRFVPDAHKEGGRYEMVSGEVKAIDTYRRVLRMTDNREIFIEQIVEMELGEQI